jgi:hypothetical protein
MESEALILFQQTTRGKGSRRFKVYRITDFEPVDNLMKRFEKYLRRNRFPQEVHIPHWLETKGPMMEGTLSDIGRQFRHFTTFHLFAVTNRNLIPFVAVPMEVDVIPALADAVRVRIYDADDCDENHVPHSDADPKLTIDDGTFEHPLSGPASADGLLEWYHLFALQSAMRLATDPSNSDDVGKDSVPTKLIRDGDSVIRVDLRSRKPLKRLSSDGLFVNYGADEVPGDSYDDRLTNVLRESASIRYRYARHMWAIRNRKTDERMADDPDSYKEELEASRARFFFDLVDTFDGSIAPFSSGVYGGALRKETATRADTFTLGGNLDFEEEMIATTLDNTDADYDPEFDLSRR